VDAPLVGSFLDYLETERGNSVRTRNARLAAIHSLFRFAALRHPDHAALIERVLAVPRSASSGRSSLSWLTRRLTPCLPPQTAPRRGGRRDHALLLLDLQTGLRVSGARRAAVPDVVLGVGPHVRCMGKGRKERITPFTKTTAAVIREWMKERGGQPDDPLFPSSHSGGALSRYAVTVLLAKHVAAAEEQCPSLRSKSVSPHVLRHTCAMRLLQAGVDISAIALWLGHEAIETAQIYVHADLALKERALARTTPIGAAPGRYRPPDELLAFLEGL